MTLIAFRCWPNRAEVLTDGLAYSPYGLEVFPSPKAWVLRRLDAVLACSGPMVLGETWMEIADSVDDVDYLDRKARQLLPAVWSRITELDGSGDDARLFTVGYSPHLGRFVAYGYASADGFRRVDLTDHFYASPCPISPLDGPPASARDWAELAKAVHADYATTLAPPKVIIGGEVTLTRLQRGAVAQERVHAFPTVGRDWRRMLIGTIHPSGQLGPCKCGSGQPFGLCHLNWRAAEFSCPCGSGQPFDDCHRLPMDTAEARAYWRRHAHDFWDTQAELAASYQPQPEDAHMPPPPVVVPPRPQATQEGLTAALGAVRGMREALPALQVAAGQTGAQRGAAAATAIKVGRNDPCPCGSGRKAKRCCGGTASR